MATMSPIFEDPVRAQQMVEILSGELKKSKDTIRQLRAKADSAHTSNDLHCEEEQIEVLRLKLMLAQETVREHTTLLEIARREVDELNVNLQHATLHAQQKVNKTRQLTDCCLKLDKSREAREPDNTEEPPVGDTSSKTDKIAEMTLDLPLYVSDKAGGIENRNLFRRPPTQIPIPTNGTRPRQKVNDVSSFPNFSSWPPPQLIDSLGFREFWPKLGVNPRAIANRKQLLTPVCGNLTWTNEELKYHLDSLYKPHGFNDEFFYVPRGLLRWGTDMVNAVVFGPFHVLHNGKWIEEHAFSKFDGRTTEFFFAKTWGISYAGTYRCYHSKDWFPEGVQMPGDLSTDSLYKATVKGDPMNARGLLWQFYSKYKTGELRVDSMVLEFLGFNDALYDKLCASKVGSQSKRKSKDQNNDVRRKKAR